MKKVFNISFVQKITRSLASFAALFTMVMAPVAQGAQIENFTKVQMQSALDQMGLNKQITVGDFYKKNKHLFPVRIQKEIEPILMNNKNQMMPQVEVVMTKGSDGRDIPNMRFTKGNDLINVQWFGEENRYVKFQNLNLTEIDLTNFNDIFSRITNSDEKIRKQFIPPSTTSTKNSTFSGFPAVTNVTWKAMTQKERAGYIVQMRLLWNDSRRVLIEMDKLNAKKGRKTSAIDLIQKMDQLFALFGQPSEAAGKTTDKSADVKKVAAKNLSGGNPMIKADGGSSAFVSGDNCIVAGYVSTYKGNKCAVDNIYGAYTGEKNILVQKTREECGPSQVACNPYIYGTPNGKAACIPLDESFQKATHIDGPCEALSSLGGNRDFLKNDLRNGQRYDKENRKMSDAELDESYFAEQQLNAGKSAESFLNGLLAYGGKAGVMFSEPLTADILANILAIKNNFDEAINTAKVSCEKAASNKSNEKNFWGACDQLHRRFLNVARFLQKSPGCKDGGKVNEKDLLCSCPAPQPGAIPGASCAAPPPVCATPVPTPTPAPKPPIVVTPPPQVCIPAPVPAPASGDQTKPPAPKENCEKYAGAVGLNDQCKCPNGDYPKLSAGSGEDKDGPSSYQCGLPTRPGKPGGDDKDCGILCTAGNFLKNNALTILLTVGTVYAAWKILTPKKVTTNPAKDLCPNGTTSGGACVQACGVKVWNATLGACACAECALPTQTPDATTCLCSTTSSTQTSGLITCPDGVSQAATLEACPARTITCWDGSTVQGTSDLNCPEKPSATKAKPGGTTK